MARLPRPAQILKTRLLGSIQNFGHPSLQPLHVWNHNFPRLEPVLKKFNVLFGTIFNQNSAISRSIRQSGLGKDKLLKMVTDWRRNNTGRIKRNFFDSPPPGRHMILQTPD